jgi:predicted DNA-binding transcriptional regulator YafY
MNRRGFLRAVGATGLLLSMQGPAVAMAVLKKNQEDLLRQALAERREVEFTYHGFPRRVEPHALGHATEGRLALLGWQVAGGSASEPPPGWRTFVLVEITELKLTRETFAPRADYRPQTTKLKPIVAEIVTDPRPSLK